MPTNGWERKVIPFQYVGPSSTPEYILITFTTNSIPGGGSAGDEVFIDDVELIYNSAAELNDIEVKKWVAYHHTSGLQLSHEFESNEILCVSNLMGQKIHSGTAKELNGIKLNTGMYIVSHHSGSSKIISE